MLHAIHLPNIKKVATNGNNTTYEITPLYPGYGMTLAVALRRILFTSVRGSAVTAVKIKGVDHEFSAISGVKEDVVSILLNLKQAVLTCNADEAVILKLSKKGVGPVTLADFEKNSSVDFINKDLIIANITDKSTNLEIEIKVEQGRGYVAAEAQKDQNAVDWINLDANYSPIVRVEYNVTNTRVGNMTDLDKITLNLYTKEGFDVDQILSEAAQILIDHFQVVKSISSSIDELSPSTIVSVDQKVDENPKINNNVNLEDLNLSSRTLNAILAHGLSTIDQLQELGLDGVKEIKGLGQKGITEISAILSEFES